MVVCVRMCVRACMCARAHEYVGCKVWIYACDTFSFNLLLAVYYYYYLLT